MKHTTFAIAGIVMIIAGTAFATGENTTVATKGYVDNRFQDKITTGLVSLGDEWIENLPSLVSYDSASGLVGNKYGILDYDGSTEFIDDGWQNYQQGDETNLLIPTVGAVGRELQFIRDSMPDISGLQTKIPKSGYKYTGGSVNFAYNTNAASDPYSWLNANVKGTGLVTRTASDGNIGERKIFEASDISGYHAQGLTQNEKDIQDISIPTVGAMMTAISNGVTKITWSATETTAVQNYSTTFDGTTGNWPAADAGKLVDGTGLATAMATKQNKIPGYNPNNEYQSVLTDTTTDGVVGKKILVTYENLSDSGTTIETDGVSDDDIPTALAVADNLSKKQFTIPKSGYYSWTDSTHNTPYNTNAANVSSKSWLNAAVAGTGLVTRTANNGVVGERKIFEATDVSGYSALTGNNKLIADISIPTVGAMMSVLANGTSKIAWGATETTAVQNYSTTFDGTTNNWPAADSGKLVDGTGLATALAVKQNKKVCVGWPDNVEHTDANCWLWDFPD